VNDQGLREIADLLKDLPEVLVTTHVNPDGDAVGSSLAFLHAYRALDGDARYVQIGEIAAMFSFLPGFDDILRAPEGLEPAPDVLLALDCASPGRIGAVLERMPETTTIVNIDHHATNTAFGDLNVVDDVAGSTGEIVFRLFGEMGVAITPEIATNLYAAIVTDTGRFGYPATTPETHLVAAELLRAGIRSEDVCEPLFRSHPESFLRLTAALIQSMGTRMDGRIAWVEMTHAMCDEAGIVMEDAADMVDIPAEMEGVEVAALFRETKRPGVTKVSLRSKCDLAVNEIMDAHDGGGHPKAAGCLMDLGLEQTRDLVLAEVEEALRDA
jgi:phosphoesterase RecJ-like protein